MSTSSTIDSSARSRRRQPLQALVIIAAAALKNATALAADHERLAALTLAADLEMLALVARRQAETELDGAKW
jgi:hypothetical protein